MAATGRQLDAKSTGIANFNDQSDGQKIQVVGMTLLSPGMTNRALHDRG
jgi:hypothetical protein